MRVAAACPTETRIQSHDPAVLAINVHGATPNRWSRRQWRTHLRARPSRKHDGRKIRLNWVWISRRIWRSRIGMERLDECEGVRSYSCESNRFGHEERLGKRR